MGNTEEAFNFYKSVFGGDFAMLQRMKETPDASKLPSDEKEKIMHIALPVGNEVLMATDMLKSMGHELKLGNNISLAISADTEEQAKDLFKKLSAGGKVDMDLEKMFWGQLFGMVTDKFGIQWMVTYDYKKM